MTIRERLDALGIHHGDFDTDVRALLTRCEREKRFMALVADAPVGLQDDINEMQAAAGAPATDDRGRESGAAAAARGGQAG